LQLASEEQTYKTNAITWASRYPGHFNDH